MKTGIKEAILFLLLSFVVSASLYRDALWGGSLLAPLDLGPVAFENYTYMSEKKIELPKNHFIIDQFTYDLPLQKRIHEAYRSGEIPWWDPYTYGGRPLLADAHINGTDPLRVAVYLALPFELAYNWNLILRGLLTGLGMFLLLRFAGVKTSLAIIFAFTYQFAGWFTLYFGHPWIQGSFIYYPFIWLTWMKAMDSTKLGFFCAMSGLLTAAVFYAGNIQSHTYLPLFGFSFLLACLIRRKGDFYKSSWIVGSSGFIGALLASPVLINQVEFYLLSKRAFTESASFGSEILSGALALPVSMVSSVYPWALGSFETIQPLRGFGAPAVELNLFFGSLTLLLILFSWLHASSRNCRNHQLYVQSIILVVIYLIIICSPLRYLFYSRCSALAGMGITMMCALGMQHILKRPQTINRMIVIAYSAVIITGAVICTVFGKIIYPILLPKLRPKILEAYASKSNIINPENLERLRLHQIDNFTNEISMFHPEALLAILGVACFSYGLLVASRRKSAVLLVGLVLTKIPVVLHHERFRPKHPCAMWERMEHGGAEQMAMKKIAGKSLRVDERSRTYHETVYPMAMPALYEVHHVQGYSALQPPSIYNSKREDYPYLPAGLWGAPETTLRGHVETLTSPRLLYADDGKAVKYIVAHERMNQITIEVPAEDLGRKLLRTDTLYPGWECSTGPILKVGPCFGEITASSSQIILTYTPTGIRYGIWLVLAGAILTAGLATPIGSRLTQKLSGLPQAI